MLPKRGSNSPIEAFPFGDLDNLLIFNGNHRAFAQWEIGKEGIWVREINPRGMGGEPKRIEQLPVFPGDRDDKQGFQLPDRSW
jgi:hypothetical protein